MKITFDIESNGLLDSGTVDYLSSPYRLKDTFKMHCIVVHEHETDRLVAFYDGDTYVFDGRRYEESVGGRLYVLENYEPLAYEHKPLAEFKQYVLDNPLSKVIGHNIINFDLLACKLYFGMDYAVEPDMWCEKPVEIYDTMVVSKTLNPDRFGGHSLDALSEKTGVRKREFRKELHQDIRFEDFAADMLYYCIFDVKANTAVYNYLEKEKANWDWDDAISLEKSVAEIITRQTHRGFAFNRELAEKNIRELDAMMEERRQRVEPLLPPRPATQAFMKDYIPPKIQFKKNGEPSSNLLKFVDKHGGKFNEDFTQVEMLGKVYDLPLPTEPLVTTMTATIDDTTHIKNWLVSVGWEPTEYKEKDLSVDSKKQKLSREKYEAAVERYVEQTMNCAFVRDRCDHLGVSPEGLRKKLLGVKEGKGIKVLTNPSFTVGQEKEIDPALNKIAEEFPHVKDIVEYLTYKHRRNSILGGGLEWDDEEEPEKGYLANVREDGRIPTPADTCGAATSRMKHRSVANIPRVTSLYGKEMRGMFGVEDDCYQIGYDFDSLEAREEAHYCWKWENTAGKPYCQSLLQEKPNDVHTMMSKRISEIIGREFGRSPAKSVKYGCLPTDNTEVLTVQGWRKFEELAEGDRILSYNTEKDCIEKDVIERTHFYQDAEVILAHNKHVSFESTGDHRWYGWTRKWAKQGPRPKEWGFKTTETWNQDFNILNAAEYVGGDSPVKPQEAALVAWLVTDGHYKWSEKPEGTSSSFGRKKGIVANICQSKNKFWKEVEDVLKANQMTYTRDVSKRENGNDCYVYRLVPAEVREFLGRVVGSREQKHDVNWTEWLLGLSRESIETFLYHFWLAEGSFLSRGTGGAKLISQNPGKIADALTAAALLTGHKISIVNHSDGKCKIFRLQGRRHTTCQELKREYSRNTDVFCLTTGNGTFIVRQGSFVSITGNCTYGAQEAKVAKTIGSDLHTGTIVFNAFWDAAEPLKLLKDALKRYWETTGGKKFILGIDGRKVPTRSAHAILNSLFQSAGVICAKRAMVIHDRMLKEEGLGVDFFKDDWKNKQYCQQLIAYHDEAQLEVKRQLVKFKIFDSKEEAEAFSEEGKIWSDVAPAPAKEGKFFRAYCRAGELAALAVRAAGEYYRLKVPLTAGYIIGRNWAECH